MAAARRRTGSDRSRAFGSERRGRSTSAAARSPPSTGLAGRPPVDLLTAFAGVLDRPRGALPGGSGRRTSTARAPSACSDGRGHRARTRRARTRRVRPRPGVQSRRGRARAAAQLAFVVAVDQLARARLLAFSLDSAIAAGRYRPGHGASCRGRSPGRALLRVPRAGRDAFGRTDRAQRARDAITIVERRPPWREDLGARVVVDEGRTAAVRRRHWTLCCSDSNDRWWLYDDTAPARDVAPLLVAIDEDVTGIFWG